MGTETPKDMELKRLRLQVTDLTEALDNAETDYAHVARFCDEAEAQLAHAQYLRDVIAPIFGAEQGAPTTIAGVLERYRAWVGRRVSDDTPSQKMTKSSAAALLGSVDTLEDIVAGRVDGQPGRRTIAVRWAPSAIQRAHNYLTHLRDEISSQTAEDPDDWEYFRLPLTRGPDGEISEAIDVAIDALRSAGAVDGRPSDG